MLKIILPIYKENFNLQKFQKTLQFFLQIMNIKNFSELYTGIKPAKKALLIFSLLPCLDFEVV